MLGMSELLLEENLTPSQHESVRKILKSGEILLKMVGDVLDIGKVEAGKLVSLASSTRVLFYESSCGNIALGTRHPTFRFGGARK